MILEFLQFTSIFSHVIAIFLGCYVLIKHNVIFRATKNFFEGGYHDPVEYSYIFVVFSSILNLFLILKMTEFFLNGRGEVFPPDSLVEWLFYHTCTGILASIAHSAINKFLNRVELRNGRKIVQ